jgi:hypothetical protein
MEAIPIRNARVVVLALAGSTLMISGVFVFLRVGRVGPVSEAGRLLAIVVPLLVLANTAIYVLLRRGVVARVRPQGSTALETLRSGSLPREFLQLTLIGCALAESVGLLGGIAYFLGAPPFLLAAPALALLAILAQFPTSERCEALLTD